MTARTRATADYQILTLNTARRSGLKALAALSIALCAIAMALGSASAQPQSSGDAQKEYDQTFDQLLHDPTNVQLTYRFAELAVQVGNFESAITALERMLLFNPNLPQIKIELADLYIHLGSYDVAQVYLNQARAASNLSPELLSRIDKLQGDIDHGHSRHKWAANVLVGLRYQSNANAGPAGSSVLAGGVPATLNNDFVRKSDWNAFFAGTAQHSYDLGLHQNATWETNVYGYGSKQFVVNRVDLAYFEVNTGPRFDVGTEQRTFFSMRPYVLANDVLLGDNQYFWTGGAGVEFDRTITSRIQAGIDYEYRNKSFANSNYFPTADLLSSSLNSLSGLIAYHILDNGILTVGASVDDEDARAKFNSNQSLEVYGSYTHSFQLPYQFPPGPLVITPAVYRIYTNYGAPDPAVSPTEKELTQEWRFMLTGQLGLTKHIAANIEFMRQLVYSGLVNFKYDNTQVIVGLLFTY